MKLNNLTEEEKKERKKAQKRAAQKRYYEKNKEYYRNYSKNHLNQAQKLQARLDEVYNYVVYKYEQGGIIGIVFNYDEVEYLKNLIKGIDNH